MRVPAHAHVFVFCAALMSLLSGCSASTTPSTVAAGTSGVVQIAARSGHFQKLHDFANNPDGAYPNVGFVESGGLLYATTAGGGPSYTGTVLQTTVNGSETVLHAFDNDDGGNPNSQLVADGNLLYGTTNGGGANGDGTVFSMTKAGKERILHSFSGSDGSTPAAGLIEVKGTFYGTTEYGGAYDYGTVFNISPAGSERVVYSFGAQSGDGTNPSATLTWHNGKLYGTTQNGSTYGGGTVFSVTTFGTEATVYRFGNGNDGKDPYLSTVTPFQGSLYGTTIDGGTHGKGVIFAIDSQGAGGAIYNFGAATGDGQYCASGVIVHRDALYGTCYGGSTGNQGNIFRVTASGREAVLYAFTGSDGANSLGRLNAVGDYLFGTLSLGGADGVGTIFRFKL
jgi:uncharacterized repeat protein (TIGR03803 family)